MVSYTGCWIVFICPFLFSMFSAFSMGFHVVEFVFLYHSLVGLIIEREKFINLKLIQRDSTKTMMSLMADEMIKYSKDKHSLSCLISPTGNFIILANRVLGKSRYQLVLDHLQLVKKTRNDEKKRKKKRKSAGKQNRKV